MFIPSHCLNQTVPTDSDSPSVTTEALGELKEFHTGQEVQI
jgi:hypothetical protein